MNTANPEQVGCSAARLERVGSAMQRYADEAYGNTVEKIGLLVGVLQEMAGLG